MFKRKINQLINLIAGHRDSTPPEIRLFNFASAFAVLISIVSLATNIQLNFPLQFHILVAAGIVVITIIYLRSRFHQHTMPWLFVFVALVSLSISWLYCEGPFGSINYVYLLCLVVFMSIIKREHLIWALVLMSVNLAVLFTLYVYNPSLVHNYGSNTIRLIDILITFIYSLVFIYLLVNALRINHEEEKYKVEVQKTELEVQNKYMKDSIYYARDIQKGFLQDQYKILRIFKNAFIFWQPKDIVSGDFYLFKNLNGQTPKTMVVVADCTGHGVPGALITMLGISFINDAVYQNPDIEPHELLNNLRERIKSALSQGRRLTENRDGMDMAVCMVDTINKKISFAGSNRSLFLIRNKEIEELKGDRMPIGPHELDDQSFTRLELPLKPHDKLYMFTDGYTDQYGDNNKKMYLSRFKTLLLEISLLPMVEQRRQIIEHFFKWKNREEQTDDVLVVGFEPLE